MVFRSMGTIKRSAEVHEATIKKGYVLDCLRCLRLGFGFRSCLARETGRCL